MGILGPPYCGIGATIPIGREMLCLPYAGFFCILLPSVPRSGVLCAVSKQITVSLCVLQWVQRRFPGQTDGQNPTRRSGYPCCCVLLVLLCSLQYKQHNKMAGHYNLVAMVVLLAVKYCDQCSYNIHNISYNRSRPDALGSSQK